MDLIAVVFMLGSGGAIAIFVMTAMAMSHRRAGEQDAVPPVRDSIAASLLHHIVCCGGVTADEAMRRMRRLTGVTAPVTTGIDVSTWAESYARAATPDDRSQLLETAVRLIASAGTPVPLRQYAALLDLSFGLGFQTDALARLRQLYGFEYVDHAKDARPRSADRRAGATTLFRRDSRPRPDLLNVLGLPADATRQEIGAAYRKLVMQHHPDRFHTAAPEAQNEAAMRFIEITRAYEELLFAHRD